MVRLRAAVGLTLGQLGAVVAAIPMTWALSHLGWTPAYLSAAAIGIVLLLFTLVFTAVQWRTNHRRDVVE